MDQLNTVLAQIRKHHFWVLVGVVVVVGLAATFMAAAERAGVAQEKERTLENAHDGLSRVAGLPDHPNQEVINAIQERRDEQAREVFQAWESLYAEQRANYPWPRALSPQFRDMIRNRRGPQERIPPRYREEYQNYVTYYFATLFDEVGVMRREDEPFEAAQQTRLQRGGYTGGMGSSPGGGMSGYPGSGMDSYSGSMDSYGGGYPGEYGGSQYGSGGRGPGESRMIGTFEWDANDRNRFVDRFFWQRTPNTLQIWLCQEDLWIYETLLRIIRNTNEGATSNYNATVKRVERLAIGSDAAPAFATLTGASTGGMASPYGGSGSGYPGGSMPGSSAAGSGPGGATRSTAGAADADELIRRQLLSFRYVDETGTPLASDDEMPYPQFKMVPVHMRLVVDQRRLPRLLVECANSPMPVEVRAVKINPEQGPINLQAFRGRTTTAGPGAMMGGMDSGSYGGSGYPGSMGPMGGMGGMGGPGQQMGSGRRGTTGSRTRLPASASSFDAVVEILGIVLIYEPPDLEGLEAQGATIDELIGEAEEEGFAEPIDLPEEEIVDEVPDLANGEEPPAAPPGQPAPGPPNAGQPLQQGQPAQPGLPAGTP